MPELPEVETTLIGIKPFLEEQSIIHIEVRNPHLRIPIPDEIQLLVNEKQIHRLARRGKYIIIQLSKGNILIHLGMSGHLRLIKTADPIGKHDHVDLYLSNHQILRYCDPRRFGLFHYIHDDPLQHPLLNHLGPEPLSDDFDANYVYQKTRNRKQPIKSLIMNNEFVVGVGNIYATESLFYSNIHPLRQSDTLTDKECALLSIAIKKILHMAIHAGGTTLKDFYSSHGKPGYFSMSLKIYGRQNEPCYTCNHAIEAIPIGGRKSAYCPCCQQ